MLFETLENRQDRDVLPRQAFERELSNRWSTLVEKQRRAIDRQLQQVRVQFLVILDVALLLAFLDLVERRLRDINVAALHQFAHLAIKESQQ